MSRSIHTTWKDYWEKKRFQYADADQKEQALREIQEALLRKKVIKKQNKAAQAMTSRLLTGKRPGQTVGHALTKYVFNVSSIRLGDATATRKLTGKEKAVLRNSRIVELELLR